LPEENQSMETLTIVFELQKETKNTFKYEERPPAGQPPRIGALYIQKWALAGGPPPGRLTARIEPAREISSK
jgi:hypothetical protein